MTLAKTLCISLEAGKMVLKKKARKSRKLSNPQTEQTNRSTSPALDKQISVHRFFHLVNYRSWNQIDVFHKYRDPSISAENHAIIYKSDLERISNNSDIPESLRKVAFNLVRNFKSDEFVTRFAELTDVIAERNANQGIRNIFLKVAGNLGTGDGDHRLRPEGNQPKKIKLDSTLESNVEETASAHALHAPEDDAVEVETARALEVDIEIEAVDLEDDDEETEAVDLEDDGEETEAIDLEDDDDEEEIDATASIEYDDEEIEATATPSNVLEKGTSKRVVAVSTLQQTLQDPYQDPAMKSRIKRFKQMDQTKFWKLSSGRTVEQILFEKSINGGASYKIRSYTIDYTCVITQKLFTNQEWTEIQTYNEWELPDLEETTFNYLESVCNTLQKGGHPTVVPFPADDWNTCNLVLRTALACNPSAHSEAFWARHGWPALKDLLNGVDGITMLDGEKYSLESTQHKNKNRRLDVEVKTNVEKKTIRKAAGMYNCSNAYISLFHEYPPHVLPTEAGDWVDQFIGLWFLLRVKIAATQTIQLYNQRPQRNLRDLANHVNIIGYDNEQSTMEDCTLASSPLGPDSFDY
ncbi:hypothetical protein BGZ80_005546 [Entomortierella chlamydospora]|uniref:Uncharacterized protein n=1 Tax=Entomortierella chlamydospora TaxID=101097 RepID=A0A9P6SUI8_9FUNG|nr:hypothetical protein BGZ80_005546 [Entomortierella chlamydospora]